MEWLIDEKVEWVTNYIAQNYPDSLFRTIPTLSKKFAETCSEMYILGQIVEIGLEKATGCREHIGTSFYEDMLTFSNELHHKIWQTQNNDYRHRLVCGRQAITKMMKEYLKVWRKHE